MSKDLMEDIVKYAENRQYVMPNIMQAMAWVNTEVGEVYELLLQKEATWVRNNPDSKTPYSSEQIAEELGDIIFMVMIAGYAEGVNPLEAMKKKMARKLSEKKISKPSEKLGLKEANAIADAQEELRED